MMYEENLKAKYHAMLPKIIKYEDFDQLIACCSEVKMELIQTVDACMAQQT